MASFYGTFMGLSGSGDGTSDYNQLLNVPIKNVTGTEDVPILLAALEPGSYNLNGYFRCGNNTDVEVAQNTLVKVLIDSEINQKLIKYDSFESDTYYINIGAVVNNTNVSLEKIIFNSSESGGGGGVSDTAKEVELFTF
jgi:hypothetical protein